jgi:hypothetical protein
MTAHPFLVTTRHSLHAVAEHVMAAALYRSTGRIGLRQCKGGFCTPKLTMPDDRTWQLRLVGTELIVDDDIHHRHVPLTTLRHAGEHLGIEAGAPAHVYRPSTPLDVDAALRVDAVAARRIATWFELTQRALERLCADLADHEPAEIQLWPEHFDLATTIAEVNFGGSPGDTHCEVPYLYVGPWSPPEPDGDFWNEPFGASRTDAEVRTVDQAFAFFQEGWERVRALRAAE